eukprot:scaffold965_cov262-Pinguiococcus_pyrenoidosus.AAC.16
MPAPLGHIVLHALDLRLISNALCAVGTIPSSRGARSMILGFWVVRVLPSRQRDHRAKAVVATVIVGEKCVLQKLLRSRPTGRFWGQAPPDERLRQWVLHPRQRPGQLSGRHHSGVDLEEGQAKVRLPGADHLQHRHAEGVDVHFLIVRGVAPHLGRHVDRRTDAAYGVGGRQRRGETKVADANGSGRGVVEEVVQLEVPVDDGGLALVKETHGREDLATPLLHHAVAQAGVHALHKVS